MKTAFGATCGAIIGAGVDLAFEGALAVGTACILGGFIMLISFVALEVAEGRKGRGA